jgi:hypothetical protein
MEALSRSVGNADAGLCAMLGHKFAPVFVEFTQKLGDGELKFLRCEGVLLRADIARNQRGSILQGLNESGVIHFGHKLFSGIDSDAEQRARSCLWKT